MALFAVDKPLGVTSHDVVDIARDRLGTRRVGHTGTLDPLATGVLVIASDSSTKLVPFLSAEDKEYLAWVSFGATTPTLDAEGQVSGEAPVKFGRRELLAALPRFLEIHEQVPPAYSAVKVAGRRAYDAARKGQSLVLSARPVRYLEAELLAFDRGPAAYRIAPSPAGWKIAERGRPVTLPPVLGPYPTAVIRLVVGSGTYVRSFARDLGEQLLTKAFLAGLVRTRVGRIDLARTISPQEISMARAIADLEALSCPVVELAQADAKKVLEGVPLPIPAQGAVALVDSRHRLLAMAEGDGFKLKIKRVFKPQA